MGQTGHTTAARRIWRRHPWRFSGFVIMVAVTLFLALRIGMAVFYWSSPDSREVAIEGWMPVGYIAHSWEIPRETLAQALGIDPGTAPRRSLASIAAEQGVSVEDLTARITLAIAAHREAMAETMDPGASGDAAEQ